jgi:hypothetical protein
MAERKPAKKGTRKSAKSTAATEGAMWPTSFALTKLTAAEEARISALVKKAVG